MNYKIFAVILTHMCFEDSLISYNENKSRVLVRQNGDRYLLKPPAKTDCTRPDSYLFGSLARHELDDVYMGIIFTDIDETDFNILLYEDAVKFFKENDDCDLILGWPQDYSHVQYGLPVMSLSKYKDMTNLTPLNKLAACLNAEPTYSIYRGLELAAKKIVDIVDSVKSDIYQAAGAVPGTKLFNSVTDLIRQTMTQVRLHTYGGNVERTIAAYLNSIIKEKGYIAVWASSLSEPLGNDPKLNSMYGDIVVMKADIYDSLKGRPYYEILDIIKDDAIFIDVKVGSIYDRFGSISETSLANFPASNHWYMCVSGGFTKISMLRSTHKILRTKPFDAPAFNLQDAVLAMEFDFPL